MLTVLLVIAFVAAFLVGSVPWGVVISKKFFDKDVRDYGSGNIGTTNAFRALGSEGGTAVFALDFGKGIVAELIAMLLFTLSPQDFLGFDVQETRALFTGVALIGAVLGHVFSPWLKGKGGKGVATAGGALFFVFGFIGGIIELAVFAATVIKTRYVSAGSLCAAVACTLLGFLYFIFPHFQAYSLPAFGCCVLTTLLVFWAHRSNIKRLKEGTESKISMKTLTSKKGEAAELIEVEAQNAKRDSEQQDEPIPVQVEVLEPGQTDTE